MSINGRRMLAREIAENKPLGARCRSVAYAHTLSELELFAADPDILILLEGETGTGKSTLARWIHDHSPRRTGPFHPLALSGVADELATVELFGSVAGAYTGAPGRRLGAFASANGGTLFLDEIGKASPTMQSRLVHAIEARTIRAVGSDREVVVDARMVAATSVPLVDLVREEKFLGDLYERVKTFRVRIPPLRERRADIPDLVRELVARYAQRRSYGAVPVVDHDLMAALQAFAWPGNLRELDGAINRLLLTARGAPLLTSSLCRDELAFVTQRHRREAALTPRCVADALSATGGNQSAAARLLGVDRTTLWRYFTRAKPDEGPQH